VRCWGASFNGQLGYGNTESLGDEPGEMPTSEVELGGSVVQLTAGGTHSCALLEDSVVRCWGDFQFGVLGFPPEGGYIGDHEGEMPPPEAPLF
jgi:alpha-tubulin suppressor-like RCC1 family protein